jgi:hypothetical protein
MVGETLEEYYTTNMHLLFDHGFSLPDIEHMFPFELEVYIELRKSEIERRKQQNAES